MRRRFLVFAFAAVAVVAGVVIPPAAPAAHAGTDDFTFDSFSGDYTLGRGADGHATLKVVETLVAEFPDIDQNHGIERAIPLLDPTTHASYRVSITSVTDGAGAAVPFTADVDGDFLQVRIGDADTYVHGAQTYVITYDERDVVDYFANTDDDEFYWDINGSGWAQSFGSVEATVHLADGLAPKLTGHTSCYLPDDATCTLDRTDDGFHVAVGQVAPSSTLTIAVGFAPHTFVAPPRPDAAWQVAVLPWVLLGVLVLLLIGVLLVRILRWRGPRPGIIVPEYEGPEIGVAQAAALLDRTPRGLPAQLVQFVVTGAARLVEQPQSPPTQRYRLDVVDRARLVNAEDQRAFDTIFAGQESRTLDRTDQNLGDRVQGVMRHARASLRGQRFRAKGRSPLTIVAIALAILCVAGGVYAFVTGSMTGARTGPLVLQLLGMIVLAVAVVVLAIPPLRLTAKGAQTRDQLLGLRMYLQLAEADRLRVLQSPQGAQRTPIDTTDGAAIVKLYERLLPWAIVWGVEDQWARTLGEHYATTPVNDPAFAGTSVLLGFGAFSSSLQPASFATTPTTSGSGWSGSNFTSSSGGSSGGGFSGGGGGGGGGGGW